jgi:hypothetical protein
MHTGAWPLAGFRVVLLKTPERFNVRAFRFYFG